MSPTPNSQPNRASERSQFHRSYASGLKLFLESTAPSDLPRSLGDAALAGGWTAGEVAMVHLRVAGADKKLGKNASTRARAALFLRQVLGPLAASVRASQANNQTLQERNAELRDHARALASGNRSLERAVARRETAQLALQRGRLKYRTLFLESQIMQKKLRQLTRQIIYAQEEERKKISRELHDEVVQTLVGINVELAALGKGASNGLLTLRARIAQTQKLVTHSVNTVHRFARELRPAVLDDLGLVPALRAFCANLATRQRFKTEFVSCPGVEALAGRERTVLFRVAQEALTNIARHAKASRVTIRFSERAGMVRMEVSDDGRSFPVAEVLQAKNPRRLGLVGMRERVEMVGGTFEIVSQPGRGTTVSATVPLVAERAK